MGIFVNELVGAIVQVLLFALIPFIWWLITARKKENFFKWIGFKKIEHEGKVVNTVLITIVAVVVYGGLSILSIKLLPEGITTAGSDFAGMGAKAIPAVVAYGFIRTGFAEELLFRGFLLKRFSNKFGLAAGNTIQAILFGLLHGVPFGLATGNVLVTVLLTILPGAFGWFQGWLNEKRCGGSIIPSWLLHGTINTIVAILSL